MRSSVFVADGETAGLERTKTIGVARRMAVSRCCSAAAATGSGFERTVIELDTVANAPPVVGLVDWPVSGVARFVAIPGGLTGGVVVRPAPGDAPFDRVVAAGAVDRELRPDANPDTDGPAALVCLAAAAAGRIPTTVRPSVVTDATPHRLRTLSPNSLRSSIDATDPTSETARPLTFARTDGTSAST